MEGEVASRVCLRCGGVVVPFQVPAQHQGAVVDRVCSKCGTVNPRSVALSSGQVLAVCFAGGLVIALAGAYLIRVFGYQPYMGVLGGAATVTISLKPMILGPLALAVGLACMGMVLVVINLQGVTWSEVSRAKGYAIFVKALMVLMVLAALAGCAAYFWLRNLAKGRGYDV